MSGMVNTLNRLKKKMGMRAMIMRDRIKSQKLVRENG